MIRHGLRSRLLRPTRQHGTRRAVLDQIPVGVRAKILAVLEVVRAAPPPKFSGGGMWEAMRGSMAGYFEIRTTGPGRRHYRLYCLLENGTTMELEERGFGGPMIVVLNGLAKPNATLFDDRTYRKHVRAMADDYRASTPRRIAT